MRAPSVAEQKEHRACRGSHAHDGGTDVDRPVAHRRGRPPPPRGHRRLGQAAAGVRQRPVAARPRARPRHGRRGLRDRGCRLRRGAGPAQLPARRRPGLEHRGRGRLPAGHLRLTAPRSVQRRNECSSRRHRLGRLPPQRVARAHP